MKMDKFDISVVPSSFPDFLSLLPSALIETRSEAFVSQSHKNRNLDRAQTNKARMR